MLLNLERINVDDLQVHSLEEANMYANQGFLTKKGEEELARLKSQNNKEQTPKKGFGLFPFFLRRDN